jgi:hypothetical protein
LTKNVAFFILMVLASCSKLWENDQNMFITCQDFVINY